MPKYFASLFLCLPTLLRNHNKHKNINDKFKSIYLKKKIKILEDTVQSKLSSTRLNEAWITRNIKRVFKTRKGALSKQEHKK